MTYLLIFVGILLAIVTILVPEKWEYRTQLVFFLISLLAAIIAYEWSQFALFFAVLFVLILVHEWGHFIVAKKTGMRVDEFGIGFPPKLFGFKKGETEYTFNALPIGGFVRIWGENYDEETNGLNENEGSRAFSARPKWAQALVLVAGVAMNIIFAWFLLSAALMIGVPSAADENEPGANASLTIMGVLPDSPAAEAGIPAGATVLSLSTDSSTLASPSPSSFRDFIVDNAGQDVKVIYEKGSEVTEAVMMAEAGIVSDDNERPAIGVSLSYTEIAKEPIHRALYLGAIATWDSLLAIAKGLTSLLAQTVTGTADFSQVAGPIGIAGLVGDAAEFGWTSLMLFTAMISLNLAVINLLPVPALDGGRLVFVAIEAVTKKEIPPIWAMRVNMVGFAFLMLLMILVTYGDITKLI